MHPYSGGALAWLFEAGLWCGVSENVLSLSGPCRGCGDPPSRMTCFVQSDFAGVSVNPHQRRICSVSCSSVASSWPSTRSTGTAPRPEDASQTPWASRSSSGRMRRDEVGMSRASAASSTCSTVMERRMPVAPVGVVHSRPSFSTSSPEVGPYSRKPSLEVKMTSSAPWAAACRQAATLTA